MWIGRSNSMLTALRPVGSFSCSCGINCNIVPTPWSPNQWVCFCAPSLMKWWDCSQRLQIDSSLGMWVVVIYALNGAFVLWVFGFHGKDTSLVWLCTLLFISFFVLFLVMHNAQGKSVSSAPFWTLSLVSSSLATRRKSWILCWHEECWTWKVMFSGAHYLLKEVILSGGKLAVMPLAMFDIAMSPIALVVMILCLVKKTAFESML